MDRILKFDKLNNRIVYLNRNPDQKYWASIHGPLATRSNIERGDRFVTKQTSKYLCKGSRVIDAGCGTGATVYGLDEAEFDSYGVDYDVKTVSAINSIFPNLSIQVADIRNLPFKDCYFDGVWSLGVIEHFLDGYESIIQEAHRVLSRDGYLFLTVPSISPLKNIKIKLGKYDLVCAEELSDFFQFAFHPKDTVEGVSKMGFELVDTYGRSGSLGLYEDANGVAKLLGLKPNKSSLLSKFIWRGADYLLTPFSYHMKYFVFKKI